MKLFSAEFPLLACSILRNISSLHSPKFIKLDSKHLNDLLIYLYIYIYIYIIMCIRGGFKMFPESVYF